MRERARSLAVRGAVLAALVAREVGLRVVLDHGERALLLDEQGAELDAHVAHLAPELAPRVAHDPVGIAPAHDGDNVVDALALVVGDAAGVFEDGAGVDAARDGAALVDLLLHGVLARDGAVLRDGDVGVLAEADALALGREGGARARDVLGLAGPVARAAQALLGLRGARDVGLRGLVRDARAGLLRDLVEPLVRAVDGAAVARVDVGAVQDMLDGDVDVDALGTARDLDAVAERRDGAVRPARAAVLRDVLVAAHGAKVGAVDVAPVPLGGEVGGVHVLMRQRRLGVVATPHDAVGLDGRGPRPRCGGRSWRQVPRWQ